MSEFAFAPDVHGVGRRTRAPSQADYWGAGLAAAVLLICLASPVLGFKATLGALAILGAAAAILGLVLPVPGVLGIGMLCTLDAMLRVFLFMGGALRWNSLNYWLLLTMLIYLPQLLRLRDASSWLLAGYVLLISLQLVYSPDPGEGLADLLGTVTAFGILLYFVRARREERIWYWIGVLNGVLAAAISLVFLLSGGLGRLPSDQELRINPNAWSYCPLTALFSLCLAFPFCRGRGSHRVLLGALVAVNTAWIVLSGSRGSALTALICLCGLFFVLPDVRARLILSGLLMLPALWILGPSSDRGQQVLHRYQRLFDSRASLGARTSGRWDLMRDGWRIVTDYRLGIGTGGYMVTRGERTRLDREVQFRPGRPWLSHSAWVKIMVENGPLGLLLFAGYLLSFAVVGWRRRTRELRGIGLLVTLALSVAFLSTEGQAKGLWFLAAGAAVLLGHPPGGFTNGVLRGKRAPSRGSSEAANGG
jgi:hypothetical protein